MKRSFSSPYTERRPEYKSGYIRHCYHRMISAPLLDRMADLPVSVYVDMEPGRRYIIAAWSHNKFVNEVKIQHPKGTTIFTNTEAQKSGAMSITTGEDSTTKRSDIFITTPGKKSSATITGMSFESKGIGSTCRIERVCQPSTGPLSVRLWKFFYEGSDYYFEASHGGQPLTMSLMILDTTGTPTCPVSEISTIEQGLFGKIANFQHTTPRPDVLTYDAEDRISIDFDYAKRDPERVYRSDAQDSEVISQGRKHKLIFSFPMISKGVEHDSVAVHSIMAFKQMAKPALSDRYDGPGMRPRFDLVRLSSSSLSTLTEDGYIHTLERIWNNHRSTTIWVPNPLLEDEGQGIFVVLVTLANGAQSFSKIATQEKDFPFAKARLELVGAREGLPAGGKAGFVW